MNQKLTFEYIHSICSIRMERHKWMNDQEKCFEQSLLIGEKTHKYSL